MDWQAQADELAVGERRKIPHCGSSPSAYIERKPEGVSLYCFRCQEREFESRGVSFREWHKHLRDRAGEARYRRFGDLDTSPLEDPATPAEGRLLGLRAGLRPEVLSAYHFAWSESMQRVVIPVLHNKSITGEWIARAVMPGHSPKYIAAKGMKNPVWFCVNNAGPIAVVEDVLSAIKISINGFNAVAVLGTSIPDRLLNMVEGRRVLGWFDPDPAGDAAFLKLRKRLAALGINPARIRTEHDPKFASKVQIQGVFEGRHYMDIYALRNGVSGLRTHGRASEFILDRIRDPENHVEGG